LHALVGLQKRHGYDADGKEIRPDKARKMGLVDMVVDAASLEEVAIKRQKTWPTAHSGNKRTKALMNRLLEDTRPVVPLSGVRLKRWSEEHQRHVPAPYAIMDCVSTVSNTLRAMTNSSTSVKICQTRRE
jgi:enoyl-CoA hydratase/carnithine racemase